MCGVRFYVGKCLLVSLLKGKLLRFVVYHLSLNTHLVLLRAR